MSYAPIALFLYNRSDKAKLCLDYLSKNEECADSILYIFCDGPKNEDGRAKVLDVWKFADSVSQSYDFKEVIVVKSETNKGLAKSIIGGVTEVLSKHKKVIVLEDDLLVSQNFLKYMNGALDFYENNKKYGSVSAFTEDLPGLKKYPEDIYMMYKGECWGWATWEDRWQNVDWQVHDYEGYLKDVKLRIGFEKLQAGIDRMFIDWHEGRNNSWAVRWCYHLFKSGLLTVYPRVSLVKNIGMDGTGTHFADTTNDSVSNEIDDNFQDNIRDFTFGCFECDHKLQKENYKCCYPFYWRMREILKICIGKIG